MEQMPRWQRYAINLGIALDEAVNTITGGDPHETISSRLGKAQRGDFGVWWRRGVQPLCFIVDMLFGKGHCQASIIDVVGGEALYKDNGQV